MSIVPSRSVAYWDAFDELVDVETDDCVDWPWQGTDGYGSTLLYDGRRQRVHVIACERAHGPRPSPRHQAAHSCGRGICMNGRHLRWATPVENSADRIDHGTSNRGERHGLSTLNEDDIRAIRQRRSDGAYLKTIAAEFGVSVPHICDIVNRRRWAWLT